MSCTDKKNLLVDNVVEDNGSMSWGVKDVTDSYKLEFKKWKNTSVLNRDALKKDVIRRFERFDYYRRLEIRDTDISDQAKREWIEEKNKSKGTCGIQIECENVGHPPQQNSASASSLGV